MRLLNRFLIAVLLKASAQLFIQPRLFAPQLFDSFAGLLFKTRLTTIHMIETTSQFAGKFNMWQLILTDRYLVGTIDQDIGTHQQRITEEAIGRQILGFELFLLILVSRDALKPAKRRHHRHQQVQFSMLRYFRLDEQSRLIGINPGRQPVDNHVPGCLLNPLRIVVMSR